MSLPFTFPALGLGTWQLTGAEAVRTVRTALELGYRHVDTATAYANEEAVGEGIRASGVPRGDLLVVTKFPEEAAGAERRVLRRSLALLGVAHLDLWLLHGPAPDAGRTAAIWRHFVDARAEGLVRAIGVCNFTVGQLDGLTAATGVAPAVNQTAFGPHYFEPGLGPAHAARGVVLEAHSPFSENRMDDPVLVEVAERHGCDTHQVVLGWHRAHGVPVVAKSASPRRLAENLRGVGLALTPAEVAAVDRLGAA
ncbi:aldo/keto reductase [Saccharothrix syringae]|uniref:Aldo/keto reductase n=1 Tax=Saccharothrix syringae TaxID=103733 RepID=A0A5Q0GQ34_SACSY|nr:aldo/keto reductase [Saccharothrix syringae]QFZ16216.1 aldo/keto reductase [Saccharothrix syringae]